MTKAQETKVLTPWQRIQSSIKEAKDTAKREAHSTGWLLRSRGAFITAVDSKGDRLDDGYWGVTTKKDFFKAVQLFKEKGAILISIEGGYDAARSVRDWGTGDYEPWVSEWCVDYWTK